MKVPDDIDLYAAQQAAARVAARAEIRDVRLFGSSVELDHFPTTGSRLKWSLDTDVAVEREEDDSAFILRSRYSLVVAEATEVLPDTDDAGAETDDGDDEGSIADISFEFAALFHLEMRDGDDPVNDAELQAFAFTTGQFALYPFAREYVYDVTGRLGLPPLTVGVLQLPVRRDS
ncbi:SecB chaperone [Micromonospora radicis]|uniref:SecB chaperone n=1 Tax=Micromonospora radicis TaxID=1894971 RepID=A0A418MXJ3_9ACTN|nr:SecB chaperone [Micromonospora radicis]RIV39331.1 SecB chaperone [Micromonospora radicis]